MKNLICVGLGIFTFLLGCDSQQSLHKASSAEEVKQYQVSLREAGIKTWKSPAKDIMDTHYLAFYQEEGMDYLVWENKFLKTLEFYCWEDDSLTSSIHFNEELIKSRCSMRGAYIASLDSIYFMDPMDAKQYKLHLFDKNSRLLHTLKSKGSSIKALERAMPEIAASKPAIRRGDWLHLVGVPEGDFRKSVTYAEGKIDVAINLKTGEYRYGYHYPAIYKEYGSWGNFQDLSRCLTSEGKFLYSFGIEDSVRLTDHEQSEQLFYAGSDYIPTSALKDTITNRMTVDQPIRPYYGGIQYDSLNGVYYRMALHALPKNAAKGSWADQPISIIILNKNFKKVGESLLPATRHLYHQWFVGPDGLYIANHYHHRQQANKGELSFTHYELVTKSD